MAAGDRRNEAVATARQGFDKTRIVGRIAECFAQFVDGRVQAVVEVDERIRGPVVVAQLFPGHHFAWPLQQDGKDVKRLFLQLDAHALLMQLTRAEIYLKRSKAQNYRKT